MAIGDQYFSNVVLACSFDSAFVDESLPANTITAYGNAVISATQSKFGDKSAYFDGTGDYLTLDGSSDFIFGTGDFTIEMWIRPTSAAGGYQLFDFRPASTNGAYPSFSISAGNVSYYTNTAERISAAHGMTNGVWSHIAVVRYSGSTSVYVGGVQKGSSWSDTTNYLCGASRPIIGANGYTPTVGNTNGYIDDLRITKGVARYTVNFTPPTLANPLYYGQVQGTVRDSTGNYAQRIVRAHRRSDGAVMGETLSNPSNGIFTINTPTPEKVYTLVQDHDAWITYLPFNGENNSTVFEEWNGKQVTPYGNAKISTAQSKFGGASAYFDGGEDYLRVPHTKDLDLAGSDFCIEFHLRPNSVGAYQFVMIKRCVYNAVNGYVVILETNGKLSFLAADSLLSSWAVNMMTTSAISTSAFTHIAITRNGSEFSIYLDGVLNVSSTSSVVIGSSSSDLYIGIGDTILYPYTGYIDDLKISKGKAQYLSNFTPPTLPHFTPQEGDPYWNNVVLGCHFDGYVDNGDPYRNEVVLNMRMNALTDDTGKAVTVVGNTNISTSTKKYGSGSAYFDGTGDYLNIPYSADFDFGTGDFTVELWAYITTYSQPGTTPRLIAKGGYQSSANSWIIYFDTSNHSAAFAYGNPGAALTIGIINLNTWTHLAVVRAGGVARTYINGVEGSTANIATSFSSSEAIGIGAEQNGLYPSNSYIDDLRITKGIARYTTDFTPPTTELPTITGSKWIDSATSKTITPYGNAVISDTQSKFGGYSVVLGSSTANKLSIASSKDFALGNGFSTIEFWAYPIAYNSSGGMIIGAGGTANAWNTTTGIHWYVLIDASTISIAFWNGSVPVQAGAFVVSLNGWVHVAFSYDGTTLMAFKNGVLVASRVGAWGAAPTSTPSLEIGNYPNNLTTSWFYSGYIDDLRITKGIARYTGNFTPPNAAFYNNKSDTDSAKYNALIYDMVVPA